MNKQTTLLPQHEVSVLTASLARLATGLAEDPRPLGACFVHDRASLVHLLDHPTDTNYCRGEVADQWLGHLARHGTGVLSATRAEWLDRVQVDGLVWPCPAQPTALAIHALEHYLQRGKPVLILGQADALAPAVRALLEVSVETTPRVMAFASAAEVDSAWHERFRCQHVVVNQRRRSLAASKKWNALLTMSGGPVLARHATLPCWIWETPQWPGGWDVAPDSIFSLQTFWLVAEATGDGWGLPRWRGDRPAHPCCVLGWRNADGSTSLLLGNLENGMCGESAHAVSGLLAGPSTWHAEYCGEHLRMTATPDGTHILLAGHQRAIIRQPR